MVVSTKATISIMVVFPAIHIRKGSWMKGESPSPLIRMKYAREVKAMPPKIPMV